MTQIRKRLKTAWKLGLFNLRTPKSPEGDFLPERAKSPSGDLGVLGSLSEREHGSCGIAGGSRIAVLIVDARE